MSSFDLTFIGIQKENFPTDKLAAAYSRGLVLDLDKELLRYVFLLKEAKHRGFFENNDLSMSNVAVTQQPLLTWSFLDFMATRKLDDQNLVELGCGNSTVWFGQRFKSVRSFETDPRWIELVTKKVPSNVTVTQITRAELESASFSFSSSDWLLVDFAGNRTCFLESMLHKGVKPSHIILDNSDWYRMGASLLIDSGYTEIPFFGFKSSQTWISCTSIFLLGLPSMLKEGTFETPQNARAINNSWDKLDSS